MSWAHCLALIAIAFVGSYAATPVVRSFALRHGIVDLPGGRKIHKQATPRIGGVAIFFGMALAIACELVGERFFGLPGPFYSMHGFQWSHIGIFCGVAVMFLTGLIDDIVDLTPGVKLMGQIVAASIIVASDLTIGDIPNPFAATRVSLGIAAYPITILYLVAFANVINLIDGLDGLAAGIAVIAATGMLFIEMGPDHVESVILDAALIGACLAFLRFNFHPASIFMGDSGALTIGFMIGVISLLGITRYSATISLIVPIVIVGVPVIDTAFAIIRRLSEHKPIQQADKGHIHHRLMRKGYGQRKTVLIIYAWSIVLSAGGYLLTRETTPIRIVTFIVLALLSLAVIYKLGLWESVVEPHRAAEKEASRKEAAARGDDHRGID